MTAKNRLEEEQKDLKAQLKFRQARSQSIPGRLPGCLGLERRNSAVLLKN